MRPRSEIDPELHILRSAVALLRQQGGDGPRGALQLECARFNLYTAFELGDEIAAGRWLRAARAAVVAYATEPNRAVAAGALDAIETAMGDA